jgi:hypothetical protein
VSHEPDENALSATLVTLAGTPDDASEVRPLLGLLATLSVLHVRTVEYAAVTGPHIGDDTLVAARQTLVHAWDDYVTLIDWPGFADAVARFGLNPSVTVQVFTAGGTAETMLSLYSRDERAMAPLDAGLWRLSGTESPYLTEPPEPEPGARDLLAGYAAAMAIRGRVQRALSCVEVRQHCCGPDAYRWLCAYADRCGTTMAAAAEAVLHGDV